MQVDRQVEAGPAEAASEVDVVAETLDASLPRDGDQLGQVWITEEDGGGSRFHHVAEVRARVSAPQRSNQRGGEHHVADQAQTNEQNSHTADGSIVASSISMIGMSSLTG